MAGPIHKAGIARGVKRVSGRHFPNRTRMPPAMMHRLSPKFRGENFYFRPSLHRSLHRHERLLRVVWCNFLAKLPWRTVITSCVWVQRYWKKKVCSHADSLFENRFCISFCLLLVLLSVCSVGIWSTNPLFLTVSRYRF
jgi:hypothetical protein